MKWLILIVLGLTVCAFAEDDVASAAKGVELIRAYAKDPNSLIIERIYSKSDHKPDHPQMCIRFRARDSFGGYNREMAEYKGGTNLTPNAQESFSACAGIEQNWSKAIKKGWVDLTDEYMKVASAAPGNPK